MCHFKHRGIKLVVTAAKKHAGLQVVCNRSKGSSVFVSAAIK